MIHRVKIYLGPLGFEVFELEMPFLQVLDYHNSPGRARTRHGELDHRTHGLLATNSPWRADTPKTRCWLVPGNFLAVSCWVFSMMFL
jgi:hypothetical protein